MGKMDNRYDGQSCQLGRIQNHPGDKMLGLSIREFLGSFDWGRKTYPNCGLHHSIAWGLELKKEKMS